MILITDVLKFIAFNECIKFLTFSLNNVIHVEQGFTVDFLKIVFLKGHILMIQI